MFLYVNSVNKGNPSSTNAQVSGVIFSAKPAPAGTLTEVPSPAVAPQNTQIGNYNFNIEDKDLEVWSASIGKFLEIQPTSFK